MFPIRSVAVLEMVQTWVRVTELGRLVTVPDWD